MFATYVEIILNTCGSTITIFLLCYLFTNLENVELGYDEGGVYVLRLLRGCSWAEVAAPRIALSLPWGNLDGLYLLADVAELLLNHSNKLHLAAVHQSA